jgi:hypothetical protein
MVDVDDIEVNRVPIIDVDDCYIRCCCQMVYVVFDDGLYLSFDIY